MKNQNSQRTPKPQRAQKPSWQIQALAEQIQFPPRHSAASQILDFLARKTNDAGVSFHGYESIKSRTNVRTNRGVSLALQFIRDFSIQVAGQPILTWRRGSGGASKKQTNSYKLHIDVMQKMVKLQGIFNEDGKRMKYAQSSILSKQDSEPQSSILRTLDNAQSCILSAPVEYPQSTSNPQLNQPPNKKATIKSAEPISSVSFVSSNDGEVLPLNRPSQPKFSLKRWCGECNAPSRRGDGDECPACRENITANGDWLQAPRSEAEGKRMWEGFLATSNDDERREVYLTANSTRRRWIAAGRFADEQARVLSEGGKQ